MIPYRANTLVVYPCRMWGTAGVCKIYPVSTFRFGARYNGFPQLSAFVIRVLKYFLFYTILIGLPPWGFFLKFWQSFEPPRSQHFLLESASVQFLIQNSLVQLMQVGHGEIVREQVVSDLFVRYIFF